MKAPSNEEIRGMFDIQELELLREDMGLQKNRIKFQMKYDEFIDLAKTREAYSHYTRAIEEVNRQIGRIKRKGEQEKVSFEIEKLKLANQRARDEAHIRLQVQKLHTINAASFYRSFYREAKRLLDPELFEYIRDAADNENDEKLKCMLESVKSSPATEDED